MITTCPTLRIILHTGRGIQPVLLTGFYVPQSWASIVQWVSVEEPSVPSDHQRVQLHIQETLLHRRGPRSRRTVVYPIPSAQPKRVVADLLAALTTQGIGQDVTVATWDLTAHQCVRWVHELRKRTLRRRKAVVHRCSRRTLRTY